MSADLTMAMGIDDVYFDHPELWTEFERREHADDDVVGAPLYHSILPPFLASVNNKEFDLTADGFGKEDFDKRLPAFGWTNTELDQLISSAGESDFHDYYIHKNLRRKMCRRLICCSGAKTTKELCEILRAEIESGVPAPVPDWYIFSNVRYGPDTGKGRRFGYNKCANMNGDHMCYETEDMQRQFSQCSQCKLAVYCSEKCQRQDWKARHKVVCKKAKKQHDRTMKASSFLDAFARKFDREA